LNFLRFLLKIGFGFARVLKLSGQDGLVASEFNGLKPCGLPPPRESIDLEAAACRFVVVSRLPRPYAYYALK